VCWLCHCQDELRTAFLSRQAEDATVVVFVAYREAIETALREGKPILMDELRLPQGSPI
jgi:hypothetical protein